MEEYSKGSNLAKAPILSVDPWSELAYVFRLTATVPYLAKWAAQRKFPLLKVGLDVESHIACEILVENGITTQQFGE